MDDLFANMPVPVHLSPKLEWLKRNCLLVICRPEYDGQSEDELGRTIYPWMVMHTEDIDGFDDDPTYGGGMTQDEAIADYARRAGLKLWNEENHKP